MDVHIDLLRRHRHAQEHDRVTPGHQQSAISLAERVLQRSITDIPSIEEQVLHPVVAAADRRVDHITRQLHVTVVAGNGNERLADLGPVKRGDPLVPALGRGQIVQRVGAVCQRHVDLRIGQGDAGERFDNVAPFGLRRAQKFSAHGRVIEQVFDPDLSAHRHANRLRRLAMPAMHDQFVAAILVHRATAQ